MGVLHTKPVIVIAGATASGKSALALALAEALNGVVINADAMQIYQDLAILTSRPTPDHLVRAPHRLYGCMDGNKVCSVGMWRNLALEVIAQCHAHNQLPIVCGGTGLYLNALIAGFAYIPPIDASIQQAIQAEMDQEGPAQMHRQLQALDPQMAAKIRPSDPQRITRALAVLKATGKSLAWWQAQPRLEAPEGFAFHTLALDIPRAQLYARCNLRLDKMMTLGVVAEIAQLIERQYPPSRPIMRAIGVRQFAAFITGKTAQSAALTATKTATRRYAKRQFTWLRHNFTAHTTIATPESAATTEHVVNFLSKRGVAV